MDWFKKILLCESFDFIVESRAQQKGLAIFWAASQYAFDIGSEADVEHSVRFVQDDAPNIVQFERTAIDMVDDATRGSDDDLNGSLEGFQLFRHVLAPSDFEDFSWATVSELDEFTVDLSGKFAGWDQDQGLGVTRGAEWIELFKNWDRKRSGFSGSRPGLADHIVALQCPRDDFCLNWAGFFVPESLDCPLRNGGEFQVVECFWRLSFHGPVDGWCSGQVQAVAISFVTRLNQHSTVQFAT